MSHCLLRRCEVDLLSRSLGSPLHIVVIVRDCTYEQLCSLSGLLAAAVTVLASAYLVLIKMSKKLLGLKIG